MISKPDDKETLDKYMDIIDTLEYAMNHAYRIDSTLGKEIESAVDRARANAGRVSYRVKREEWIDVNG